MEKAAELWELIIANRYVGAAAIVLISFAAAYIIDFFVTNVCRAWTSRTTTTVDDRFIELIHRPVRMTVLLVGLWIAMVRLELPAQLHWIFASTLKSIAVLVWSVFVIRFVNLVLVTLSDAEGFRIVEPRTRTLFDNLTRVVVVGLAIYFILIFWHVNVAAWIASAGIMGVAVGFAAKDTIANLFAGIFVLTDAPYEIGDFINLDTGERGQVTHVGLRSTRLLTRDDVEVTIPNAVIANAKIVNETGGRWTKRRIRVSVGVAYGSDVDRVKEILFQIGNGHPQTCEDPAPRVRFRQFGESSLDFELMCWVDEPVLSGRVLDALNTEVYKNLAKEGIEIPYPKRDVYIRQMPGAKTE